MSRKTLQEQLFRWRREQVKHKQDFVGRPLKNKGSPPEFKKYLRGPVEITWPIKTKSR